MRINSDEGVAARTRMMIGEPTLTALAAIGFEHYRNTKGEVVLEFRARIRPWKKNGHRYSRTQLTRVTVARNHVGWYDLATTGYDHQGISPHDIATKVADLA